MLTVSFQIQLISKMAEWVSELNKEMDSGGNRLGEGVLGQLYIPCAVYSGLVYLASQFSGSFYLKIRDFLSILV